MAIKQEERTISIQLLEQETVEIYFLGTSWLMMNRMAKKATEHLLVPPVMRNRASRKTVLKHDPPIEFRNSMYLCRDESAPTLVHVPDNAFKKAMAQAALDTPGATKAEIGRHVQVVDETVHVYGTPLVDMRIVRQAGFAKTPDVRTRAIFKRWGGKITVRYTRGIVRETDIVNLMANAGMITGIGDGRIEKGALKYGGWEVVAKDNPVLIDLMKNHARAAQKEAYENPVAVNDDTEELLAWFHSELVLRERDRDRKPSATTAAVVAGRNGKSKGKDKEVEQ